jgi:hypothetical protein
LGLKYLNKYIEYALDEKQKLLFRIHILQILEKLVNQENHKDIVNSILFLLAVMLSRSMAIFIVCLSGVLFLLLSYQLSQTNLEQSRRRK